MEKVLITATLMSHIAQFHKPLIRMLKNAGYEVHIAAKDNLSSKNGLKIDLIDKAFNIDFARSPLSFKNMKAYKKMKRVIKDNKYEYIHCNTPMGGLITRMAANPERKKGTKVFYTVHGFHFYKGAPKLNWILFYPIEKFMSRLTDVLITITKEDYELAKKKKFKCTVRYIDGVGVNTSKFNTETLAKNQISVLSKENFNILNIGELNNNKNQIFILESLYQLLEKFPQVRLYIAGNGPNYDMLNNYIIDNNLQDNVFLLDYVLEIEKYIQACDLIVSSSYREGLPLNIMEAMTCGKPILASDNRGHRELIEDGYNGFLYEVNNITQFNGIIANLIEDTSLADHIAANAKIESRKYSDLNISKQLEVIYFE